MENQNTNKPNTVMCVLAYLGFLSLIPLFAEKNDEYVQFHAKQGVNLFIIEILITVICSIISFIPVIGLIGTIATSVCGLLFFILAILGIVAAVKGEKKPLPIVGGIKIVK